MKKITYPLLCFQIRPDAVLGILVGADYQVVEENVRRLKGTLSGHLHKLYKKSGEYPLVEIGDPIMKMVQALVRPTYREDNSAIPMSTNVTVSTPLVYGEREPGIYECFLPLLDEHFFCYDISQMDMLAKHFIVSSFDDAAPEDIYRFVAYPAPFLEILPFRVKEDLLFNYDWNNKRQPQNLERLAERYPYPKSVKRNVSALPDAAWQMEEQVAELVEKLLTNKASVILTGDHGVGKSAVLRAAIRKITTADKKSNAEHSFWRITAQRITAASKYLGEWQAATEELVWELNSVNGILWVEDVVQLLKEGGKGAEDSVAAYLLPFMQSGKLQLVGEATPPELESMRRMLPGFVESVQVMELHELTEKKLNRIFDEFTNFIKQNLKIHITKDAQSLAFRLLRRYFPYENFPGKGILFLGECLSEAQLNGAPEVTRRDIIAHFVRRTGLPELFLRDDLLLDQTELNEFFNSKIIGQSAAVAQLSDIVKVFKAGLNNPYKPITTLIFAGPTGVGKTSAANALAQYFFGKGQKQSPLVRIDMSEFQHASQITRFLGEGGQPGKLVADVRERPFAVLLLDEAEKADPSIFDAFLTVLDEGMLVDAFGRVTNFRNCIIILTTNLGASNRSTIGYGDRTPGDETYRRAIGQFFRPEFINRIDAVVVFQSLGPADIRLITLKELEDVKLREGFVKRGLTLHFSENVVDYLAKIGFDERYGARPLQRALEDHILKPLANWLLRNKAENERLEVDFDEKIIVKKVDG